MKQYKHSINFGKKEKVLNYACRTCQLSLPNKVGVVFLLSVRIASLGKICCVTSRLRINGRIPDGMQKTGGAYFSTERHIPAECCMAKANFGNYSATERMKASFADFEEKFGGKVFIAFSLDGVIANKEAITDIKQEIEKLKNISNK
jgi:hypothetical protein